MEVHAHAHTPRKKWTHYFWEFLMLFLAVFCGFLAEYQLEHKIEKDRAKELARSLYYELKGDSASIALKSRNRIRQEQAISYLMKYYKDSSLVAVSKTFALNFMHGIYFRTPTLFEPRTVVLEQLKNSGSLRYFKNEELQQLIGDLSVAIMHIKDRQELESDVRKEYINPMIIRHYDYDFDWIIRDNGTLPFDKAAEKYEKSDTVVPFHFHGIDKFDKQTTINTLGLYGWGGLRSTRLVHYQNYINVNTRLLEVLRQEYRLK